ncbi:hypothetical protein IMG5_094270 [Ichthyophthirius multifiliis]|uniref:EF-hand domain-containing protein n=1 Tax=Ichthyophthirius multifiliis TaxID=5932 RepID=G0QRJ6_ICHMU|nr:hypothetical protein IMG5_094270 [Ichthyophthirius multifiliis]EGR32164.1 hypothetical protein IMG5_094270 [Ichthyophthirius multifiliis]|eukprot:XP_004035650.1 hypothetical protein IMG5_094270 [Ichthyophthirius multifiliis]
MAQYRSALREKGTKCLLGIAREFKNFDENFSKTIDFNEFIQSLQKNQINLNEDESEEIFYYFDRRNQNVINYEDFLLSIRGPTSQFRRNLIKNLFKNIDKRNSGILKANEIISFFNPKMHPDVCTGIKTEEDIYKEFSKTLQDYIFYKGIKNSSLTETEFEDFFTFQSACIPEDEYFKSILSNIWNNHSKFDNELKLIQKKQNNNLNNHSYIVNNQSNQQELYQQISNKSIHEYNQKRPITSQIQQIYPQELLEKTRKKISSRGIRGFIGIQRQFRIMDDNYDKAINQAEFRKAMSDYKMNLNDQECQLLFQLFDTQQHGIIYIDDLIHHLQGNISPFRKKLIEQAYLQLDKYGNQQVSLNDIKNSFYSKCHPDVKTAKRTEDEILGEFLETFELHHNLRVGMKEQLVSKQEFHEYYYNVSSTIENDQHFENIIVNTYKVIFIFFNIIVYILFQLNIYKLYQNNQQQYQQYAPTSYKPQYQNQEHRSRTTQNAPFGTSNTPMDYSTTLRPQSKQSQLQKHINQELPAGSPSWPGYNWQVQQANSVYQQENNGCRMTGQKQSGEEIFNQLKCKVLNRGIRGFLSLNKTYRIIDDEGNRMINIQDFIKVCKDLRTGINEGEFTAVFKLFDQNAIGFIDFDKFLKAITGNMNTFRKNIVMSAFAKLDKTKSAVVDIDDILGAYNVSKHPEVLNGRKNEEEILGDFLDTFEKHHIQWFANNCKSTQVDIDEFVEYYNILSATIEDDKYFEAILRSVWRI